jgi:hypothetical protein
MHHHPLLSINLGYYSTLSTGLGSVPTSSRHYNTDAREDVSQSLSANTSFFDLRQLFSQPGGYSALMTSLDPSSLGSFFEVSSGQVTVVMPDVEMWFFIVAVSTCIILDS